MRSKSSPPPSRRSGRPRRAPPNRCASGGSRPRSRRTSRPSRRAAGSAARPNRPPRWPWSRSVDRFGLGNGRRGTATAATGHLDRRSRYSTRPPRRCDRELQRMRDGDHDAKLCVLGSCRCARQRGGSEFMRTIGMWCSLLSFSSMLGLAPVAQAITVTPTQNATALVDALLGSGGTGIVVTSVSVSGHSQQSFEVPATFETSSGTYTNPSGTYGIGPGVVLSTGAVEGYGDETERRRTTRRSCSSRPRSSSPPRRPRRKPCWTRSPRSVRTPSTTSTSPS